MLININNVKEKGTLNISFSKDVNEDTIQQIAFKGGASFVNNGCYIVGKLTIKCEKECDKCQEYIKKTLIEDINLFIEVNEEAMIKDTELSDSELTDLEDENVYYVKGEDIDLYTIMLEETLLRLPYKFVCEPECTVAEYVDEELKYNPFDILKNYKK